MPLAEPPKPTPATVTWGPEIRSWVSLLLFAHLFALFVAVTTYTQPSGLQMQLHGLFAPYLRNLHLTSLPVSYPFARYHLTHAGPIDLDFTCEVDVKSASGEDAKVVIPPPGLWPPIRYRRYQNLANAVGSLVNNQATDESFAGILPKAIAGAVLRQHDAKQGTFRCRAHYLPELSVMATVTPTKREPLENFGNVYEAQVFAAANGSVDLLKKSTTLEVAPVETTPKRSGSSGP